MIKKIYKILLTIIFVLNIEQSKAETLFNSLNSAYLNNPKLNAERASMRASREDKRGAVSEFLPTVTISGSNSAKQQDKGNNADLYIKPKERSLLVEQKIFQGFGGVANLQKKRKGQKLGEFKLKPKESKTFDFDFRIKYDKSKRIQI